MQVDPLAVEAFLATRGRQYPFREIRCTRNRFHAKWLMFSVYGRPAFPVLSRCFRPETATQLIIQDEAKPLPLSLCEIMDFIHRADMYTSPWWYRHCVDYARESVDNSRYSANRKATFEACLKYCITGLINGQCGFENGGGDYYNVWKDWFNDQYSDGTTFHQLEYKSVNFILGKMRSS